MPTPRSRLLLATCVGSLLLAAGCGSSPRAVPQVSGAVEGSAPGPVYGKAGPGGFDWSAGMQAAHDQLASALGGTDVTLSRTTDDRLWITLPGDLSFETNRAALKPGARAALDQVVVALRRQPQVEIRIVGHTDSKGSASANNALSLERAASTRDWLVARGMSPVRIAVAGRGARDPVASNDSETGRAANRRVEILVGDRNPAGTGRPGGLTPPAAR